MEITWLETFAKDWQTRITQGRKPHAILLLGPAGVGKRAAAAWVARLSLATEGGAALPVHPVEIPEHPDLRWLSPPEDKQAICLLYTSDAADDSVYV